MNIRAKQLAVAIISLFFFGSLLTVGYIESERLLPKKKAKAVVKKVDLSCVNCHTEKSPVVVIQWKESLHAALGVGCMDCHGVKEGEPDVWEHEETLMAVSPTPEDCARCHEKEAKEFAESPHANAAEDLPRLDNFGGVDAGEKSGAMEGCQKCHGNTVKVIKGGTLDPATWPNTGVGRINPDGSKGSCNVCHARHQFAPSQARQSTSCGKCHVAPEHPQIETYNESKHGLLFTARINEMNLASTKWVAGKDYSAAPTCATCHMSATKSLPVTHDVSKRVARALRPISSKKLENWEKKRKEMSSACNACHGPDYTKAFFAQTDSIFDRYNEQFAEPAEKIMEALKKEGKITPASYDDQIEWAFFELWHQEGRHAQKIAGRFKDRFLSEAEKLSPGISKRFLKNR